MYRQKETMSLIKLDKQLLNPDFIQSVNRNAKFNGTPGVEVFVFGEELSFTYTGDSASQAYDYFEDFQPNATAPSVTVQLGTTPIVITDNTIVWADLGSTINGKPGVEVRIATDAPGVIRQFVANEASAVYDILVALVPAQATGTTSN
jgi:hypothetical protein